MKILIFLHGTMIMHANGVGRSREERVRQVVERDPALHDFAAYVPVDNAVEKLGRWAEQGAEIIYFSSHRDPQNVDKDALVLRQFGFPPGAIVFRRSRETYGDVAERVAPDVLIEDDCESIGGDAEMVYPHVRPEIQRRITSIVVPEFGGIDHLPDRLPELLLPRAVREAS